MFFHLGRIATRYRWLIVCLWMVFFAMALPFAPQATQVLHAGGFVSPDFESERAITLLAQKLHFNPTIVQVIFTSRRYSADSPTFPQEAQQALTRVRGWSEVSGVISFTDNPRQISFDRHAAYVNVLLKPDPDTAPKLLPELERRLQAVPDLQTHIGGGPVFFADIELVSERDLRRAEILAFPFALIALLLVFRSIVAAILPALVGGGAVIVTLALIFGLGHLTTFSIFVLNIATLFGLGLGVDYSLFIVSRFREELAQGRRHEEALTVGTAHAAPGSVEHSGFWYRLSHIVMRYPVRVFVPVFLLLVTLGLPFLDVRFSAPDASILPPDVPSRAAFDLLAKRFNDRETTPVLMAVQTQGAVTSPDNIRKLYAYVQRIQADPRVARVDSIVSADPRFTLDQYELLYTHPQLIADPYLSILLQATVAGNTLEISVISKYGMLDARSQALVQAIRNTPPGGGITALVDGGTAGDIDYVNSLYTDFPNAVLIVALTTYLVLLLLFRSLVLPLKALLMNTLSILASYGALVVIFQDGFLHQVLGFLPLGFVEASSPILLFFALFGLSMDYEVFLLSRVQEAFWQTGNNTHSVALGLQRSGGIITSAALIVIVVSAAFATADVILVKALGLGMALAVLLDATFVRALLVPATMRLLGNLNWWLPVVGVQRHPPALAEYMDAGETVVFTTQATKDEVLKDAHVGGKQ